MSRVNNTIQYTPKRIYQIDLFRLLAAISVVLYHYLFRGYMADDLSKLNFSEIGHYFKYGYLGVDLFFIISGFVIALSIKSRSLIDFCISRVSRLYPAYWLCVLLTATIIFCFGAPRFSVNLKQILLNMTMFQNYLRVKSIDGSYWSLFVEMKFYIFIIGSYLIINKIREFKLDYLIYTWLILSILYLPFRHLFAFQLLEYIFILEWSSYFIAGILFYQIYSDAVNTKYIILLSIAFSLSVFHAILRTEILENLYNTDFSPIYITTYILIFYLAMFLVASGKMQWLNSPRLIKLGLLTYPLYLIHQNIGFVIFNTLGNESNKYLLVILTVAFMLFLSYLISTFYEFRISKYLKGKLKSLLSSE
jgi:peptidoglycan/LPS O-acetylase OafA/YrhL